MIDGNNPTAVSALTKVNADIGNLVTTNAWLSSLVDSLQSEKQTLIDRMAAYETQVSDMGLTNRNLMDQLDAVRGNLPAVTSGE
jgi:hypothetical protein